MINKNNKKNKKYQNEKQTQKLIGFYNKKLESRKQASKKKGAHNNNNNNKNNNLYKYRSTCAGAARIPTPIPATMRPISNIM